MIRTPKKVQNQNLQSGTDISFESLNSTRSQNVRKSIEKLEQASTQTGQGSLTKALPKPVGKTPPNVEPNRIDKPTLQSLQADTSSKEKGPSPKTPMGDAHRVIKSITVTKARKHNPTPSPMGRVTYTDRSTEATMVHNKGLENLNKFLNLRKDIKLEIKKALDRLYELTKTTPVMRCLDDELVGEQRLTTDTPTQTEECKTELECVYIGQKNEDQILRKIEENSKILLENSRKMDEIKTLIENQKELSERASYASVATPKSTAKPTLERVSLHSVVVTSQNDQDTGEEVLERIRQAVNAKEGWVAVEKVRKAKDRKIIMGCRTEEERKKIKNRLEQAGVHLIVEEMKNKDPLLVLKDVLSVHSDDDVLRALRNQNRDVFQGLDKQEDRMILKYRKKTRNPLTSHIVLTVSPVIWRRAIEKEKVRVDLQQVCVEDQSPLVQCSKCLSYGHGRRFCREPQDLCSHCGGPHFRTACPELITGEPAMCINCKRAKVETLEHNAFSRECPVRKKWDNIARASVTYC